MDVVLRPPTLADAAALAETHVRAWQAGYRGVLPDDFLAALSVENRYRQWRGWLDDATADHGGAIVADVDGVVRGFVLFGTWRDEDADPAVGELQALNVHPDAWGTGAGRALLQAADHGLAALGYCEAVLWVVTGNARARRFYEIDGWVPDGASKVDDRDAVPIPEVRYRKRFVAA